MQYRRAGLLDLPLIFDLMAEGAASGAFSEAFVERTGSVALLWFIFKSVAWQAFQSSQGSFTYEWRIILGPEGQEQGFLKCSRFHADRVLELLAVAPAFRNQGIGSAVVEHMGAEIPASGQLFVHCTKYARAMQHILKRHHFKRNVRLNIPRLEEYTAGRPGSAPPHAA